MGLIERARSGIEMFIKAARFTNPAAVTLTLKKRDKARSVDQIVATENFRHFRNRLDHTLLGTKAKRYGRRLRILAVLEMSSDQRWHYHCIIERPYHCSFESFCQAICDQWQRTDFGYSQINIQDQADDGWTNYILKERQKSSLLDAIDWENSYLIAE